ncbi:hypothetical protein T10_4164 [Trichinella papuae]|uniref:Uncharacterized protein n=1 Tax=Trichinella papuae TaxID=268474 RepID=A0A0V1MQP1_9BILA|nr:hypothetical protein T10_4164 [Trichinella papuae]
MCKFAIAVLRRFIARITSLKTGHSGIFGTISSYNKQDADDVLEKQQQHDANGGSLLRWSGSAKYLTDRLAIAVSCLFAF